MKTKGMIVPLASHPFFTDEELIAFYRIDKFDVPALGNAHNTYKFNGNGHVILKLSVFQFNYNNELIASL